MEITWRVQTTSSLARARPASTPDPAESIRDKIRYLPEYNALVCTQHATALQSLDTHLRDKHGVHANVRSQLVAEYEQQAWAQTVDAIVHPTSWRPPIEALGAPLDGLLCHRKTQHQLGWSSKDSLYTPVSVQTFFQKPALRRYFLVQIDDGRARVPNPSADQVVQAQLASWAETQKANAAAAQLVQADVAKTDWTA
ncbi:DUF3505 domain containing protein [Pyrenophora teres f. maculata]|nr:DUF3505 domain containing protein [Pyrenophora teres f. maculata]